MKGRPPLKPRKEPRQARSRQMREDILTAGLRVLRRDGPLRFTTTRVAEVAGISVGSLYQYFPNKQALIFAIHSQAVDLAWAEVQRILGHPGWSPREKLQRIARMYFQQESAEVAEMGAALKEAEIFFAGQPEYRAMNELVLERFTRFVREALPGTPMSRARFAARMIVTVLENTGRMVADLRLSRREINHWSRACVDMLADYFDLP